MPYSVSIWTRSAPTASAEPRSAANSASRSCSAASSGSVIPSIWRATAALIWPRSELSAVMPPMRADTDCTAAATDWVSSAAAAISSAAAWSKLANSVT